MAPAALATPRDLAHREGTKTVDINILPKNGPKVLHEESPNGCYEGFFYIGHIAEDETGEMVEVIERVPCRRCSAGESY